MGSVFGQGSTFTFQGRLTDSGGPATGMYDFNFALKDALSGGNTVGTPISQSGVAVATGLFTVQLDFGAAAFDGSARWIEIAARTNGAAGFTLLSPRTPISSVPYALRASATAEQLLAQIQVLTAQLQNLSNHFSTNIPSGVTSVSSDPNDAGLLAQGMQLFQTVAAPPWVSGSANGAPGARFDHSAAWTGQQWLIWGGDLGGGTFSASGGYYSPTSDTWQSFSSFQSPSARTRATAVWSGTEMLIWGGFGSTGYPVAGGRYNLQEQTWNKLNTNGAPAARESHLGVWTGTRMIVWGGRNRFGLVNDGGSYNPANDSWTELPLENAPEGRRYMAHVWTGNALLVWGGQGLDGELATGGRLVCDANGVPEQWVAMSTVNAPASRSRHSAIWTGSKMIVFGGQQSGTYLADAAAYDPATDSWSALPLAGGASARANHVAVWSGTEMLIFGGDDNSGAISSGAAFDVAKNKWRTLDTALNAVARTSGAGIWSGSQLIVFGGLSGGTPIANLQRLTPQPAFYFFRKP